MSATQAPGTVLDRSDADLIDAVRAGDLESYGELFARHQDSARRLALQLTRGSGDAGVSVIRYGNRVVIYRCVS